MRFKNYLLKFILTLTVSTVFLVSCSDAKTTSGQNEEMLPKEALKSLNLTIKNSSSYFENRDHELDSLKILLCKSGDTLDKWRYNVLISEKYRPMDADSAIVYAAHALDLSDELPDSVSTLRGEFAFISALSTAGIFPEALQRLDSIKPYLNSVKDKTSFWEASRRCYSYIMASVENHDYYVNSYRKLYMACDDSLLANLPHTDPFYQFILCERLVDEQRLGEASKNLSVLLENLPKESNLYGMAAYQLAQVHRHKGDFQEYAEFLAKAAESDIKGCVRDGLALPTLANWVYAHGDLDNAFRYVNYALDDANSGNIRMRTPAIAPIIPLIDTAIQRRSASARNQMLFLTILISLLLLVSVILLFSMVSALKKRRISQEKLALSSKKLETYIGNFIGLCSNYSSRLEQMSKLVTRKISAGQSDELVKLINSGKFTEDNNDEFYKLIDKALLDIFPDFVEQINKLLLPDKQIIINADEPLSPELRIYAFVRLGVDQSNRIAKILGYSVNTVYAYRNRMRNRAIDRENFDVQVTRLD